MAKRPRSRKQRRLPVLMGSHRMFPRPPAHIAEAVENKAREWGRHATLEWEPGPNCFVMKLSLRADDPQRKAWQAGLLREEPRECFFLHEPLAEPIMGGKGRPPQFFQPIDLTQMGVESILSLMDAVNLQSGRGQHKSLQDLFDAALERTRKQTQAKKSHAREEVRDLAETYRRTVFKIPYHTVGIDLKTTGATP